MLGWVAYRLYRCPTPEPFLVPVFLWATAIGTFVPTVANDYSLVFLPLAAVAAWDRRDPPAAHAALGFLLIVLQPVSFYFSPSVALGGKVAGVIAVGFCLAARLREQTPARPRSGAVMLKSNRTPRGGRESAPVPHKVTVGDLRLGAARRNT